MSHPLDQLDVQMREHQAWLAWAKLMRSIGLDLNSVDSLTFEPVRLALCEWAIVYAEGRAAGVFRKPEPGDVVLADGGA